MVMGYSFLVVARVLAVTGSSFTVVVHSLLDLALWILVTLHINYFLLFTNNTHTLFSEGYTGGDGAHSVVQVLLV